MKAPEGFRLPNPIDFETHPPPELPKYLKHQVYDKPEVFAKVDSHAIQVYFLLTTQPKSYLKLHILVWYIFFLYFIGCRVPTSHIQGPDVGFAISVQIRWIRKGPCNIPMDDCEGYAEYPLRKCPSQFSRRRSHVLQHQPRHVFQDVRSNVQVGLSILHILSVILKFTVSPLVDMPKVLITFLVTNFVVFLPIIHGMSFIFEDLGSLLMFIGRLVT